MKPNPTNRPMGIHFMLMPSIQSHTFPASIQPLLQTLASDISRMCNCSFRALYVLDDHLHIMLASSDEDVVQTFFTTFMDQGQDLIRGIGGTYREFEWDDRVHVTLVPPWHVDLMTAFVRDQEYYHRNHTFRQEIDEIFLAGSARQVMDDTIALTERAS